MAILFLTVKMLVLSQLLIFFSTVLPPWSWVRIDGLALLLVYGYWRLRGFEKWAWITIAFTLALWAHPDFWSIAIWSSCVLVVTVIFSKMTHRFYLESYLIEALYVICILEIATVIHALVLSLAIWRITLPPEQALFFILHAAESGLASFFIFIAIDGILRHPHSLWRHG